MCSVLIPSSPVKTDVNRSVSKKNLTSKRIVWKIWTLTGKEMLPKVTPLDAGSWRLLGPKPTLAALRHRAFLKQSVHRPTREWRKSVKMRRNAKCLKWNLYDAVYLITKQLKNWQNFSQLYSTARQFFIISILRFKSLDPISPKWMDPTMSGCPLPPKAIRVTTAPKYPEGTSLLFLRRITTDMRTNTLQPDLPATCESVMQTLITRNRWMLHKGSQEAPLLSHRTLELLWVRALIPLSVQKTECIPPPSLNQFYKKVGILPTAPQYQCISPPPTHLAPILILLLQTRYQTQFPPFPIMGICPCTLPQAIPSIHKLCKLPQCPFIILMMAFPQNPISQGWAHQSINTSPLPFQVVPPLLPHPSAPHPQIPPLALHLPAAVVAITLPQIPLLKEASGPCLIPSARKTVKCTTSAMSARNPSPNSLIWRCTFGPTQESVPSLAAGAPRHSPSSRTFKSTILSTRGKNHTNAMFATKDSAPLLISKHTWDCTLAQNPLSVKSAKLSSRNLSTWSSTNEFTPMRGPSIAPLARKDISAHLDWGEN